MPDAGDVVWPVFPGAVATKRRPAIVLSSDEYHLSTADWQAVQACAKRAMAIP